MKSIIISIGDELLIGQVINSNASEISQMLTGINIEVEQVLVVGDDHDQIVNAIKDAMVRYQVVITTGGLGPTKDDITQKAIAEATGSELRFSQETFDHLSAILAQFGKIPGESHRAQCHLPQSADLMFNGVGTAPGMHFAGDDSHLFVLPGVPHEMRFIMKNGVLPRLLDLLPGLTRRTYTTFATVGEGESNLADTLEELEDGLPPYIKFAYLPAPGRVRLRVMGVLETQNEQDKYNDVCGQIRHLIGEFIYAEEDIPLAAAIGQMLVERGATLSVAESCTGGYVAHLLTSISGSSSYFEGGAITYSNALKQSILDVKAQTLKEHGAVSEATALEMAEGARSTFNTDFAVSITGIAGPGGGTPEKPVGTVWIAVSSPSETLAKKMQMTRTRGINIQLSAIAALNQLRKCLKRTI